MGRVKKIATGEGCILGQRNKDKIEALEKNTEQRFKDIEKTIDSNKEQSVRDITRIESAVEKMSGTANRIAWMVLAMVITVGGQLLVLFITKVLRS